LPRRKSRFDILPFVLSFHIDIQGGASSRTAIAHALEQTNPEHLANTRKALADEEQISSALLQDAQHHHELSALALAVAISDVSGARMGNAISSLTRDVLATRDEHNEIKAELAATKATIAILAALPLMGLFMGKLVGANPFQWLLSSPIGHACLFLAISLEGIGIWWIHRLIKRASQ
jgi:tight adherence protein B